MLPGLRAPASENWRVFDVIVELLNVVLRRMLPSVLPRRINRKVPTHLSKLVL